MSSLIHKLLAFQVTHHHLQAVARSTAVCSSASAGVDADEGGGSSSSSGGAGGAAACGGGAGSGPNATQRAATALEEARVRKEASTKKAEDESLRELVSVSFGRVGLPACARASHRHAHERAAFFALVRIHADPFPRWRSRQLQLKVLPR
jgi:hypothetical protein